MSSRSAARVTSGYVHASQSMTSGISSGWTIVITGAATRPRPSPTSDCTVAPAKSARATASSAGIPTPRMLRPGSALPQVAQHVLHDPAVAVVVRLAGGVDPDDGVELRARPFRAALTLTVLGVLPSLSSVTPVIENVSSPVRPSDSAFSPSGNCSGSTPMPIRLERWIRS